MFKMRLDPIVDHLLSYCSKYPFVLCSVSSSPRSKDVKILSLADAVAAIPIPNHRGHFPWHDRYWAQPPLSLLSRHHLAIATAHPTGASHDESSSRNAAANLGVGAVMELVWRGQT